MSQAQHLAAYEYHSSEMLKCAWSLVKIHEEAANKHLNELRNL